jgi:hypothetical protein
VDWTKGIEVYLQLGFMGLFLLLGFLMLRWFMKKYEESQADSKALTISTTNALNGAAKTIEEQTELIKKLKESIDAMQREQYQLFTYIKARDDARRDN